MTDQPSKQPADAEQFGNRPFDDEGRRQRAAATATWQANVQRSYPAAADDERVRALGSDARVAGSYGSPTGGWERLTQRARVALGVREPSGDGSRYVDPDDVEHENRRLNTPGARTVARYRN